MKNNLISYNNKVFDDGCFLGVQHYFNFNLIKRLVVTKVDYANGKLENSTYKLVFEGNTNHSEV